MSGKPRRSSAQPRFATKRDARRRTLGGEIVAQGPKLGGPFMPWQKRVAYVAGELRADGTPQYRTVVVTVPRRQGKTHLVQAAITARADHWSDPQTMTYTAQTGRMAARRITDLGVSLRRSGEPVKVRRSIGTEAVRWPEEHGGHELVVIPPNADSAHGETTHLAVLDEAFAISETVLGAIGPTQDTTPHAQTWIISTAGTTTSDLLNRYVAMGRDAVNDPSSRLAYFEWSASETDDPYDPASWWEWMPALGRTVELETIHLRAAELSEPEFIRAYANRVVESTAVAVPTQWWEDSEDAPQVPPSGVAFGIEARNDPNAAAIAAAWADTDNHVWTQLADYADGHRWVARRLEELIVRYRPVVIALDDGGPATSIASDVLGVAEQYGVPIVRLSPKYAAGACAYLVRLLADGDLRHGPAPALDDAVSGARRKQFGDGLWVWDRRRSLDDITPLNAATWAVWAGNKVGYQPRPGVH